MGDTMQDIMKIVEEDIKEVIKEVRSMDYESLLVVGVLVAAFVFSYFVVKRKVRTIPPGPKGQPDVGFLPFLKQNLHLQLVELGMEYGDIFSMRLGSVLVVVLQGAKTVEEAFAKSQLSGQPPDEIVQLLRDKSSFFVKNIHQWVDSGDSITKAMKDFEINKVKFQGAVQDEVNQFLEHLMSQKGQPMDFNHSLSSSLNKSLNLIIKNKQSTVEHKTFVDPNKTIPSENESKDKACNGDVADSFQACSDTVVKALLWCVYVVAAYPRVQETILKEILDIKGPDGQTEFEDFKNMSYTHAVVMEVLRWKTVVPLNAMRYTTSDSTVGGYHIPRGTVVIADFWSVHNNPENWTEPDNFNPERFLDKNGSLVARKNYFPFSSGKRSCPGEKLAYSIIILYITSILQKFRVEFPEGVEPHFDASLNVTYSLNPYLIKFISRS